jgi:hypothetical protein
VSSAHQPVPGPDEPTTFSHRSRAHTEALGVYPCLISRDVRQAITWLQTAFGIQGQALAPPGTADDEPLAATDLEQNLWTCGTAAP